MAKRTVFPRIDSHPPKALLVVYAIFAMLCSAAASHTLNLAISGSSGIGISPGELLLGDPTEYRGATPSFSREYIGSYYNLLLGSFMIVSATAFAIAGCFHISAIHRYRHRRSQILARERSPLVGPAAETASFS